MKKERNNEIRKYGCKTFPRAARFFRHGVCGFGRHRVQLRKTRLCADRHMGEYVSVHGVFLVSGRCRADGHDDEQNRTAQNCFGGVVRYFYGVAAAVVRLYFACDGCVVLPAGHRQHDYAGVAESVGVQLD